MLTVCAACPILCRVITERGENVKLSASLLFERLTEYLVLYSSGRHFGELCLGRPAFCRAGDPIGRGRLLIADGGSLPDGADVPSDCCLISVGAPPAGYKAACTVLFAPGVGAHELFNELQRLYDVYDDWDEKLRRCISTRRDMQSIIDLSSPLFENPLCFLDASFRYTATSDCARRGGDAEAIVPRRPAELFSSDCPGAETLTDRGDLLLRRCASGGKNLLCASLRSHQQFVVGIILIENHTHFRRSDAALLAHMADYVLMLFEYTSAIRRDSTLSLVTVFIRLLDRQEVTQTELTNALAVFDWRLGDTYEVFYLKLPSPEYDYNYLTSRGRELEKLLPSALAIAYGGDIVIIHDLSRAREREPAARLHAFLRARKLAYGRSRVFSDISELYSHYLQAVYALRQGTARYPEKLFHRFSDHCLDFMTENCRGTQKTESLLPGGLYELIEYDRLHGTKYCETLRVFCDAKYNATHAADALHIHRTTFLDRMKRIREFLDVDFDSPDDRLHLLLSLRMLDAEGK